VLSDLLFRLRALLRSKVVESELDEELRLHFDLQVEKYLKSGLPREEACRQARLAFGGLDQVKEECRDARGLYLLEFLAQDVRYGFRMLRRSPAFTAVTLLTLAIGIGANTAIFSAVNALLINPYRFHESHRIVRVEAHHVSGKNQGTGYRDYLDWREQNSVFEEMAIVPWTGTYTLTGQGEPQRIVGGETTHGFLRVLGIQPVLGRFLTEDEDKPGAPSLAVLSYAAWQRRFGGSSEVLGHQLMLDSISYTIIGVLPRGFAFPGVQTCEFFTALRENSSNNRFQHQYNVLARLKRGASVERAQAEMTTIARRLEQEYPETNKGWGILLTPIHSAIAQETKTPILILFSTVIFVLLLVCANLAGLQLARASSRAREMAIRASLGASHGRIICQMLTESLLVAVGGGFLGLTFAQWLMEALRSSVPEELALDATMHLDPTVFLFSAVASVLTGILFGLAPALYGARSDLNSVIKGDAGFGSSAPTHVRLRSSLVAGQIALSLVLLVGAGLLVKDLVVVLRLQTGLRTDRVVTFALAPPHAKYRTPERRTGFYRDLLERLCSAPGVDTAALVDTLPMTGGMTGGGFQIEGRPKAADWVDTLVQYNGSTPRFFRTLGIPLLRGRDFDDRDETGSPPVAIINDTLARQFFPDEDPIGRKYRDDYDGKWRSIVGIVGSYKSQQPMRPPMPAVFRPLTQTGLGWEWVTARTSGDPERLAGSVRAIVRAIDPDVPVLQLRTMQQVVSDSLSQSLLMTKYLVGFACFALLLAAIGIYGIVAYSVRQRMREIGIRAALGASYGSLLGSVLGKGVQLSIVGVAVGIPAALALSGMLASVLYGISPRDITVFVAVPAILILAALAASYLPARQAARVDPMIALRYE
jgi:putative ABC transport system permease protein